MARDELDRRAPGRCRYSTVTSTGPSSGSTAPIDDGLGHRAATASGRGLARDGGAQRVATSEAADERCRPPARSAVETDVSVWRRCPTASAPSARLPWSTSRLTASARARTHAGTAVCAATLSSTSSSIHATPPATQASRARIVADDGEARALANANSSVAGEQEPLERHAERERAAARRAA